jgi:photosystem II stability/assembly factor-like uncharacterized protein
MKRFISTIYLIVLNINLFSSPVSKDSAERVALNYLNHKFIFTKSALSLKSSFKSLMENIPTYYIFNFEGGGWVIISANDAATPILGYSLNGYFDENNVNPSAKLLLEDYSNQILYAFKNNIKNTSSKEEWGNILNNNFKVNNRNIEPLLKCNWNQTQFYNDSCPADKHAPYGFNGRVPAGCVAIAMAQIMKYYSYPLRGMGSNSYYSNKYGLLSANFGNTQYNWANMPDSIFYPNVDIAQLVYHCGISVNMHYDSASSGAGDPEYALVHNFGYSDSITYKYLTNNDSIAREIWIATLKAELDAKRPIYYTGSNPNDGHAFICDGYDNSFPTKFHFNWGWGGYYNGYFAIGALDAIPNNSDYVFNNYNTILTNIKPVTNLIIDTNQLVCEITNPYDQMVINPDSSIKVNIFVLKGYPKVVNLYIDNELKSSTSSFPYSFTISSTNLSIGKHILKIIASNNVIDCSDSVVFYIYNSVTSGCWKLQKIFPNSGELGVNFLSIVDSSVVWATLGGKSNLFAITSNGGINWDTGHIINSTYDTLSLSNICGINAKKAYACFNPGITHGGAIFYTTDGGKTWTRQPSANFTNSWANWVYFFDENNGVCMGDSYQNQFVIYTTNNGGVNWIRVVGNNIPPAKDRETGLENSYDTFHNSIWFGTNDGRLYKSFDKGLTWSVSDSIFSASSNYYVRFKDSSNVFAHKDGRANHSNAIYKTTDAGKTWAKFVEKDNMTNLVYIPGTNSTWLNYNGFTELSTDDDSTFSIIDETISMNEIRFKSSTAGWGVANYSSSLNGTGIYKWNGSFSSIKKYKLTFHLVDDNNNALPNVKIEGGNTLTTDDSGDAVFNVTMFGNPYSFTFYLNGYNEKNEKFFIQSDTSIQVSLNKLISGNSSVTFVVNNLLNKPVEGISIFFNDSLKITNISGKVTFSNLFNNKTYVYSALKGNEYVDYGTVGISKTDNYIYITFLIDSFYNYKKLPDIIFPNPASDMFCIMSDSVISEVKVFNTSGSLLYDKQTNSNIILIPTQEFQNGIYIVQSRKNKISISKKIIIRH